MGKLIFHRRNPFVNINEVLATIKCLREGGRK